MFLLRLKKLSQIILDPSLISALLKGAAAGMEHSSVLEIYVVNILWMWAPTAANLHW